MTRRWPVVLAAVAALAAGCGDDSRAGTSHIDMGDVPGSTLESRLAGRPVPVSGQVYVHDDGCVTVVVDGVERMPVWPDGTTVTQDEDNFDRYVVELAGGVRLTAVGAGGDHFTAAGVVADARSAAPSPGTEPRGKAESFLDFCAVPAAPVGFPDASTFRIGR